MISEELFRRVSADPEYRVLVRTRRRFSFSMTALMILTYYGFVCVVALAPAVFAVPLYAGASASVGIVAGLAVMVVAVTLTILYVRRVDRMLSPRMAAILARADQRNGG